MAILNKNQVQRLFDRESVLIGTEDVVPAFRAVAQFGERAVKHAQGLPGTRYSNGYGTGDYTLMYLTFRGFQAAASFYNVQQLQEEAQAGGQKEAAPLLAQQDGKGGMDLTSPNSTSTIHETEEDVK